MLAMLTIINNIADKSKDLALLCIRLLLAYGFYTPAINKINNFGSIVEWFESMGLPAPGINAFLATATEGLGVILLVLGLGLRYITLPLIIVMIVAIATVHAGNGFNAGDNGFEIPLYYMAMLFGLFAFGGGKLSVDDFLANRKS
ncbi:MAG: hypothetical protein SchgKO_05990 [Schleiferiaceae bacterium]